LVWNFLCVALAGGSVRSDYGAGTGNGGTRRKLPEDDEEGKRLLMSDEFYL